MANRFKPNQQGIREMTRGLEREFAKHPVRVPVVGDYTAVPLPAATTINNYNAPVVSVSGDHAQLAWNSETVSQKQERSEKVAPGYESLARLLTDVLTNLANFELNKVDESDLRAGVNDVLRETVKSKPDRSVVRRGVTLIRGLLAPVGAGLSKATTDGSAEAARSIIEALGEALPFQ